MVEFHSKACQHCGVYGVPADMVCKVCSIHAHEQCLQFVDGTCPMCYNGLNSNVFTCSLCLCDDPISANTRVDSTDRMSKCVICFGVTWSYSKKSVQELVLEGYTEIRETGIKVGTSHNPTTLPFKGSKKMVCVDGDQLSLTSDPLVVHSWCAICLFQKTPDYEAEWKDFILNKIQNPTQVFFGLTNNPHPDLRSTVGTHTCIFCGKGEGWMTFCLYHMSKSQGCDLCRDGHVLPMKLKTSKAFHPSCAVWSGMQRISRQEGFGMLCTRNKDWRANHMRPLKSWLGYPSGINEFLIGTMTPTDLIPEGSLKGERYPNRLRNKRGLDLPPILSPPSHQNALHESLMTSFANAGPRM